MIMIKKIIYKKNIGGQASGKYMGPKNSHAYQMGLVLLLLFEKIYNINLNL